MNKCIELWQFLTNDCIISTNAAQVIYRSLFNNIPQNERIEFLTYLTKLYGDGFTPSE